MKAVAAPCGIATDETTFWERLRRIHDETFPTAVIERNQVYIFRILPGFSSCHVVQEGSAGIHPCLIRHVRGRPC